MIINGVGVGHATSLVLVLLTQLLWYSFLFVVLVSGTGFSVFLSVRCCCYSRSINRCYGAMATLFENVVPEKAVTDARTHGQIRSKF